jgi:hypothetical protein
MTLIQIIQNSKYKDLIYFSHLDDSDIEGKVYPNNRHFRKAQRQASFRLSQTKGIPN